MSKVTKAELEAEVTRLFPDPGTRTLYIDDRVSSLLWQCRLIFDGVHIITSSMQRMRARRQLFNFFQGLARPEPEVCICSAIRLPDGRVIRGHRHDDCLHTAHKIVTWNGGHEPGEHHWKPTMGRDQGFVTSRGRYVDRETALKLQLDAGLPSACPSGYRSRELFSEDLY